ncbi:MAG: hypothetical protein GY929_25140 [Actinomycetia bacterium]|nr:hypothetical protein [Actinomycetes bacterium]
MRFTDDHRHRIEAEPDALVDELWNDHGSILMQAATFLLADQSKVGFVVDLALHRVARALRQNEGTLLATRLLLMSAVRRAVDEQVGVYPSEESVVAFDPDPLVGDLDQHPVAQAWLWLRETDQLLLWTVDLEGCSYAALAEQLDTSVRTARARVKDARRALVRGVAMRAPGRISGDSVLAEVRAGHCREALAQVVGPLVLGHGQVSPWISVRPEPQPLPLLNPITVAGSALMVLLMIFGGLGMAVRIGEPPRPQTATVDLTSPDAAPPAVLASVASDTD